MLKRAIADKIGKICSIELQSVCCLENRESLFTYPVFHKQVNDEEIKVEYSRIVVKSLNSFSSGSGINNIVSKMLSQGMQPHDALVIRVDMTTWQKLESGTFYEKYNNFGLGQDIECHELFSEWFRQIKNNSRIYHL